jgi:hypothetical protein
MMMRINRKQERNSNLYVQILVVIFFLNIKYKRNQKHF